MAIKIQGTTVIDDSGVFYVGTGTTAQRPASPVQGAIWYNTEINSFEGYNGTAWASVGGADAYAQTFALLGL